MPLSAPTYLRTVLGLSVLVALGALGIEARRGTVAPTLDMNQQAISQLHGLLRLESDVVSFAQGELGAWMLQDGFHQPDVTGALMSQDSAIIRFDSGDSDPVSATLLLAASPFDGSPSVAVSVRSGIDEVHVELAGLESVTVALDGEPLQEVTLGCRVGSSQFDLDLGPDLRPQCLRVVEMSVAREQS